MKKRPADNVPRGASRSPAVLVVDDEVVVRELAMTALRGRGYRVLQAASATEAETTFLEQADAIDVLVTDLMLCGLGGHELSRRFKARKPELQVVVTTGYDIEQLPDEIRPDGSFELLQKPYTLRDLADTVGRLLERG